MPASSGPAIRAALLDFDGTLVREDFSDLLAEINGKRAESQRLNAEFHSGKRPGVSGLIDNTNLLDGVTLTQVRDVVRASDCLMPGAHELFGFLHEQRITTVVASGSILPVLHEFQTILGIDHVVGTAVAIRDQTIRGVDPENLPVDGFKLLGCMQLLTELEIPIAEAVAIGDSPAEKGLFVHAGLSIAINPVGGVEQYADHVIGSDLNEAVDLIRSHMAR